MNADIPFVSTLDEPYTDDDHRRMDAEVFRDLAQWKLELDTLAAAGPLPYPAAVPTVLERVICTDNRLDWNCIYDIGALLKKHSELQSNLTDAWRTGSFRDIRSLDYLQAPALRSKPIPAAQLDALRKGLTTPYRGRAVDAFYNYLDEITLLESDGFGRFCSVVQSSGAGKTRLLLELAKKDVCVLYMNIRSPDDKLGFPPRDNVPADILTYPGDTEEYYMRCFAFFSAVFKVLSVFMQKDLNWYDDMCTIGSPVRASFFMELQKEFIDARKAIITPAEGKSAVLSSHSEMSPTHGRRVVIALDDAHVLHRDSRGAFRYAQRMLFEAIKQYSKGTRHETDYVVLASTMPKVAYVDLGPAPILYPSARSPLEGRDLFQPFTQLGWDQHAPTPERVQADEVAKMEHILRYGRPLWFSLEEGFSPERILELTREKLCGEREFLPDNDQTLAALSQRFGLDIARGHTDAAKYAETGVMDHLRVCIEMTEDWSWCDTTYPPEPIVSCAAASLLHEGDHLDRSLRCLEEMVDNGIIDAQLKGLAGRLLWLLAKDLFVRKTNAPEITYGNMQSEPELLDCQPVSVVEFLAFMFGPKIWEAAPQAREAFRNAYINFSHWVTKRFSDEEPVEWSGLWQRTSAVQCEDNASGIERVIPMYFKPEQNGDHAGLSHILISGDRQMDQDRFSPGSCGFPNIAIVVDLGGDALALDVVDVSEREACLGISASGCNATTFAFFDGSGRAVARTLKALYK